jgi:hypothetical protein
MRALLCLLVLSTPAVADDNPPCAPVTVGEMNLDKAVDLGDLLRWASKQFCHTIVASHRLWRTPMTVDVPPGEMTAAEQQKRFRQAVESAKLQLDTRRAVWTVTRPKTLPAATKEKERCIPYPPNKKFHWRLGDAPTLLELAPMYESIICKPLNYPLGAGVHQVGVIIPSGALLDSVEFDRLVRSALVAEGFIVEEGPALALRYADRTFVRCVGDACEISRGYIDDLLANTADLARDARVVPSIRNGAPNGFKIYAIRPHSLWDQLGFMNGDTIQTINDLEMNTPDKALEAYSKLRTATRLVVGFERQGAPKTVEIVIK